jgi:hypothetical protein
MACQLSDDSRGAFELTVDFTFRPPHRFVKRERAGLICCRHIRISHDKDTTA